VDSVGSSEFVKGELIERMREGGVSVVEALPVGFYHAIFTRLDLRLHRKIAVIDGKVAYTGSLNMVDPRYFKQDEGVGQWVDCMVRLTGPSVRELEAVFLGDWSVESGEDMEALRLQGSRAPLPRPGCAVVQAAPSGPGVGGEEILKLLLMTVYSARRELVLTTPYFIPDEALMTALVTAAQRGVEVTIVVPDKVDSFLVRHASRSYFGDLLAAGVRIFCFREGLLHAKTVTVDGETGLIGTVNLDMRSFRLNFEVTLFVYDQAFCKRLEALQLDYVSRSAPLESQAWWKRRAPARLFDDAVRLFSPVL
jgi:cardiolipin synthase